MGCEQKIVHITARSACTFLGGQPIVCLVTGLAEEVREVILSNPSDSAFELIGSVELGVSWLHFDVSNCDRIKIYYP